MSFTPQQEKAIQTLGKNLIVVAGAGSGKTRVLVERFLYLLQQDQSLPLNALVAITFTREAALEMRNRVRKSLEDNVQRLPEQGRWSLIPFTVCVRRSCVPMRRKPGLIRVLKCWNPWKRQCCWAM